MILPSNTGSTFSVEFASSNVIISSSFDCSAIFWTVWACFETISSTIACAIFSISYSTCGWTFASFITLAGCLISERLNISSVSGISSLYDSKFHALCKSFSSACVPNILNSLILFLLNLFF